VACRSRRHHRRQKPRVPNVGFNPLGRFGVQQDPQDPKGDRDEPSGEFLFQRRRNLDDITLETKILGTRWPEHLQHR
jgi:hypothetical protein